MSFFDLGLANISGVDTAGSGVPGGQHQYWNNTNTAYVDFGGGVEVTISPKVSIFLDIRAMGTGEPSDAASPASQSDGIGSASLSAGLNYSF